jgi:hypothetical protein
MKKPIRFFIYCDFGKIDRGTEVPFPTKLILPITLILLFLTIGCGPDSEFKSPCAGSWITRCDANTEILIIGPYRTTCVGAFEQECYLEFNEVSQRWEFFYDGIRGFDFEPGFIYTLEVSLHEYAGDIQDVGKYEYRLIEVLSKEEASVDERPPRKPSTE